MATGPLCKLWISESVVIWRRTGAFLECLTPTSPKDVQVTEVSGALGAELLCFPQKDFRSTPHALNGDYSLYSQAPTTLATMISIRPTMTPTTNRRLGNNPNGIWPRVGSAYPTTQ